MNPEYLLDAMGLLDDDLIQEAERYSRPRARRSFNRWMGLAASFAVVIALGYAVTHLWSVGSNSTANGNSGGAAGNQGAPSSSAIGGETLPSNEGDLNCDNSVPEELEPNAPGSVVQCPAIMVDGILYYSTGIPIPGEVDESVIQTVTGYTSGVPEMDGQTTFSQDLSTQYAMTDLGLVVLMDGEWILFEPAQDG